MAFVSYPSLDDADIVDVELLKLDGSVRTLRLLLDSGFTGRRSFVLPVAAADLVRATLPCRRAFSACPPA